METPAANDLINEHLKIVDRVVGLERRKLGVANDTMAEEMRANAMMGLVSAVEKYDPGRKDTFGAYAEMRIRYAIYDGLAVSGWFPRHLKRKIKFLRRAGEITHYQSQNPPPNDKTEAVHRLSNQLKELATAYITTYTEESRDSVSVPPEAEDTLAQKRLAAQIRAYMSGLTEKERFVVNGYFYQDRKLPELASQMHVTTSWVSKLLSSGLRKLREMMESSTEILEAAEDP
jgi:RNA polymerase sigma factor for flagellar operon FliA